MTFIPSVADLPDCSFRVESIPASGGRRGAVILLPELWGIVPQIQDMGRRIAAEGFDVYIPDILPGTMAPTSDREAMLARYTGADDELAMRKIDYIAARLHRDGAGPVVAIGFCYGGRMAVLAAAYTQIDAAVTYYGTYKATPGAKAIDPWTAARDAKVPVLAHYGADDASIPLSDVEAARGMLRGGRVFVYAGAGHAFANETRETYRPEAATPAWQRTLAFLQERTAAWALSHPPKKTEEWEVVQ